MYRRCTEDMAKISLKRGADSYKCEDWFWEMVGRTKREKVVWVVEGRSHKQKRFYKNGPVAQAPAVESSIILYGFSGILSGERKGRGSIFYSR